MRWFGGKFTLVKQFVRTDRARRQGLFARLTRSESLLIARGKLIQFSWQSVLPKYVDLFMSYAQKLCKAVLSTRVVLILFLSSEEKSYDNFTTKILDHEEYF